MKTKGQVLPWLVVGILLLWLAVAVSFSLGRDTFQRIQLQMVADLAAEEGAAILADGLNTFATTNLGMLVLGIPAFFSGGDAGLTIGALQGLQDALMISLGPAALARAEMIAQQHDALALPLNYLTGSALPSPMVARGHVAGVPVWLEDHLETSEEKIAGERFVRLLVTRKEPEKVDELEQPTQMAVAEAVAYGQRILGEQIVLPLPEPGYSFKLVKTKCQLPFAGGLK